MSRVIGVLGLVVGALLTLCASAAMGASDDGLVPGESDVPGYHAAGVGAMLGRAAIAGGLPSSLRHTPAVGARFRGGAKAKKA